MGIDEVDTVIEEAAIVVSVAVGSDFKASTLLENGGNTLNWDSDQAIFCVFVLESSLQTEITSIPFAIDDYTRWRLMEGLDDIGLTLKNIDSVDSFEKSRPSFKPKTLPALS